MAHRTGRSAPWLTPERRKTAYDIVSAGLAIAFVYGLATQEQIDVWLQLAIALGAINSGVAGRYVFPKHPPPPPPPSSPPPPAWPNPPAA